MCRTISAVRMEELLDYATSYRTLDENSPNGTPCQHGGEPMSDLRRDHILVIKEALRLRRRVNELLETTNRYLERYRTSEVWSADRADERDRLRKAVQEIAIRAVVKVSPHGNDTPEERLKAIYELADAALYVDCYCGGLGTTRKTIAHQTGCPEGADD